MADPRKRWSVPTGEQLDALLKAEAPRVKVSWVQKLRMKAHLGSGRLVAKPPEIGAADRSSSPSSAAATTTAHVVVPVRSAAPADPAPPPLSPRPTSPPPTKTAPKELPLAPSPKPPTGPSSVQPRADRAPDFDIASAHSPAVEKPRRSVRISQEALERRAGSPSKSGGESVQARRALIDHRCTACGRSFPGSIERATLAYTQHECAGRVTNDDWRFDK